VAGSETIQTDKNVFCVVRAVAEASAWNDKRRESIPRLAFAGAPLALANAPAKLVAG